MYFISHYIERVKRVYGKNLLEILPSPARPDRLDMVSLLSQQIWQLNFIRKIWYSLFLSLNLEKCALVGFYFKNITIIFAGIEDTIYQDVRPGRARPEFLVNFYHIVASLVRCNVIWSTYFISFNETKFCTQISYISERFNKCTICLNQQNS